jgi:hypothetical protein
MDDGLGRAGTVPHYCSVLGVVRPDLARRTLSTPSREEPMADEPRDQRPKIRLSQLSHGAG